MVSSESSPPGRRRHVWAVLAVVAAAALIQLGLVFGAGLTRWKGGGYGMYSELHPNKRRVRVDVEEGWGTFGPDGWRRPLPGASGAGCATAPGRWQAYTRWPTSGAAERLAQCLQLPSGSRLRLIAPRLGAAGRVHLRVLADHTIGGSR